MQMHSNHPGGFFVLISSPIGLNGILQESENVLNFLVSTLCEQPPLSYNSTQQAHSAKTKLVKYLKTTLNPMLMTQT